MIFTERGDIISCSALARIRECGGSFALSKGVQDISSEDAQKGQSLHSIVRDIIEGKNPTSDTEEGYLGWKFWGNMVIAAKKLFGEDEILWRTEERLWLSNDNL